MTDALDEYCARQPTPVGLAIRDRFLALGAAIASLDARVQELEAGAVARLTDRVRALEHEIEEAITGERA